MKTFIVQVQLHDAGMRENKSFSTEMKKHSFSPLKGKSGGSRLAFECHNRNSINEVINSVLQAGSSTGQKLSFTVMKEKSVGKNTGREKQEQE